MPASFSDNICQIEETLKSSLGGNKAGDLDSDISSSSKRILLTQIVFKPAEKPYSLQIDSLRKKYIPLNPSQDIKPSENDQHKKDIKMNGSGEGNDGFPEPRVVLYPEENVKLEWKKIQRIGAGLVNMGNTCFLNSTLQCLTYTAPLVNYCLDDEHNLSCKQAGFCMMCELQRHIKRCYENYGNAIKPQSILQKLRMIAKHMHWGRQEDAHEFLRYLVEALQKSCHSNLNGLTKLDKFSKETTVVNQIFGGFLRSQVQCLKCKEKSNTYDPFLDISLDIKNVPTLEKAFEKYVHPEMLDNENAYMCTKCKQKVPAQKRFSIHKPSNVLTVSLKRFDFHRMMGKITRQISFQEKLNIRPYMSNKQGEPVLYNLYAVLVHSGVHCNSGHYYCFVKSPSQIWYCMNDSMVSQVSAQRVLSSEAYLLFYIRAKSSSNLQKQKMPIIGPVQPNNHILNNKVKPAVNGLKVYQTNDLGSPVPRKTTPLVKPTPSASSTSPFCSSVSSAMKSATSPFASTSTPLPTNRDKVAFGIKPKQVVKDGNKDEKPRIVMQIKNGKVTTYEKSPNGKSKIVNGESTSSSKLVPYDGESESDEETMQSARNESAVKVKEAANKLLIEGESKKSPSPSRQRKEKENEVVFDEKLNATTSVPGNYKLLETTLKDEKVHGNVKIRNTGLAPKTKESTPDRKRTFENSSLTCITSTKINATSNWHVLNPESILSPSRGSNSSKESTNSTTEWHIKDIKEVPQLLKVPECQHAGWTVMSDQKSKASDISSNATAPLQQKHKVSDKIQKTVIEFQNSDDNKQSKFDSFESVAVPDKQYLISSEKEEYAGKHKKHKKKKHKHQKDHDQKDVKYEELVNEISSLETPPKKHKKKKHKHKKEREYEEERSLKRHRETDSNKHRHDDENHVVIKKRKSDTESDDSGELVWVEKTKDSLEPISKPSKIVQCWDHHIKDGYKRNKNGFHDHVRPTWDGSKSSTVAENLEKNSSIHGYGSSVMSWDGGKNIVDREVEKDKERKRHWSDEYDDEIDAGKVKKLKKRHSDTDFHRSNLFQYVQDERNKDNSRPAYGSHSYHHQPSYNHSGHKGHHGHHSNYHHNNSKLDYKY